MCNESEIVSFVSSAAKGKVFSVSAEGPWELLELGNAATSEGIIEGVESRDYAEGPEFFIGRRA